MIGDAEGQPDFNLEVQDQETRDLFLLVELSNQLGGLQQASDFICYGTVLHDYTRGFDALVVNWVRFQMGQKELGGLQPQFSSMTDAEYEKHSREAGGRYFSTEITDAEIELSLSLSILEDQENLDTALRVLEILGISPSEGGFILTDRDEERADKIIRICKLMDAGYRQFAGLNPALAALLDPEAARELEGVEIEDPTIRQQFRELRDEL